MGLGGGTINLKRMKEIEEAMGPRYDLLGVLFPDGLIAPEYKEIPKNIIPVRRNRGELGVSYLDKFKKMIHSIGNERTD